MFLQQFIHHFEKYKYLSIFSYDILSKIKGFRFVQRFSAEIEFHKIQFLAVASRRRLRVEGRVGRRPPEAAVRRRRRNVGDVGDVGLAVHVVVGVVPAIVKVEDP
jgi:hypothetical protein